jgi:hypothetical protein
MLPGWMSCLSKVGPEVHHSTELRPPLSSDFILHVTAITKDNYMSMHYANHVAIKDKLFFMTMRGVKLPTLYRKRAQLPV